MKYSQFNVFSPVNNLIFNTLNLSMAKLDAKHFLGFKKREQELFNQLSESEITAFSENGFIIPDDFSELDILKQRYWHSKYSGQTLSLSILTTKDCNFCCPYCFETREPTLYLDDEQQNKIKQFVSQQLKGKSNLCVNWYGGEPLLNISAIENLSKFFIDFCSEHQKNYTASITTNGYLLDDATQKLLLDLQVSSAQITIDGNKEVHNSRRILDDGTPTYDVLLKHIALAEEKIYIDLRVNVDEGNIDSICDLIDDIAQINQHDNIGLHICIVTPVENGANDVEYEKLLTSKMMKIYWRAIEKGIRLSKLNCLLKEYDQFCVVDSDSQFIITPTGSLYKCGESFVDSIDPGYIGDILEGGFSNICNSKLIKWIKDPFNIPECLNCSILPLCMGGCVLKRSIKGMVPCMVDLKYFMPEMMEMLYTIIGENGDQNA